MKTEKPRRQQSGNNKRTKTDKAAPKRGKTSGESVWKFDSSDSSDSDTRPRRSGTGKNTGKSTGKPKRVSRTSGTSDSDTRPRRSTGSPERSTRVSRSTDPKKRYASDDEKPKRVSRTSDSSDSDTRPRRSTGRPERPTRVSRSTDPKKRYASDDERPKRVSRTSDSSDSDTRPRRSTGRPERPTRVSRSTDPKKRYASDDERPKRVSRTSDSSDSDTRPRRSTGRPERPTRVVGRTSDSTKRYASDDERPKRVSSSRKSTGDRRYKSDDERTQTKRVFVKGDSYTDKPKKAPARHKSSSNKGESRLNKFIANSGICSRREADEFIEAGVITVNGEVVCELGAKVRSGDDVRFNGQRLQGEKKVYVLLNKPKGYVTTLDDPHADKTVMELIQNACSERVYPVGRLDKNTTGVLLFTNDGELTKQLTHPSNEKNKIYHVFLDKNVTRNDLALLVKGFALEDGVIQADSADYVDDNKSEVGLEIHSGRNRIVRRMFEHLGYKVTKLDRVYFAGLTKKGLKRGAWRLLTPKEVNMLKMGAFK